MNYRSQFEACFEFIEQHLTENIQITDIAKQMGYSLYHFCRIFYAYQGMTPSEYLIDRRLQAALSDLQENMKLIDIAMKYNFETASGFSKAIKKRYRRTPTQLKESLNDIIQNSNTSLHKQLENFCVNYKIKSINSFWISGYCVEMDFNSPSYNDKITAYWNHFEMNNIEEKLYHELNPKKHGEIGIAIGDKLQSSKHKYLLGVMEKSENENWTNYNIQAGIYAVFTIPPVDMTKNDTEFSSMIKKVWRYIFEYWFENTKYRYDEARETFEYYDERCHYRKDAVMDIYIPIII